MFYLRNFGRFYFFTSEHLIMHNHMGRLNILIVLTTSCIVSVASYYVDIIDNGPVVKGANITFTATVYDDNSTASGPLKFHWNDNAVPNHKKETETNTSFTDTWTISYDTIYPAGSYVVQVIVYKYYYVMWSEIGSNRIEFYITETLNGYISVIQKKETVIHKVHLKKSDAILIRNAPTVLTYWFIDCIYYGVRRDFIFSFNYTQADQEYNIEALVVADFTPIPPPITTTIPTTTTTTTTTTAKPTISVTTTTLKPTTTATIASKNGTSNIMVYVNRILQPYKGIFPFVCNSSYVPTDDRKSYGYFYKRIKVKAPVTKVSVTGNSWLHHGDLLTLHVKCHGSKNLKYCVKYEKGVYNVTGKENCTDYSDLEKCEFTIQRYFVESMEHTIIIIITNEVSKVVTPVAVIVYKAEKQAHLSVIVVTVASSLVAVALLVFVLVYYLQNRSRFVVKAVDFNFGQNYSDMGCKTVIERLQTQKYDQLE